ncbi:hypothetical protein P7C70_g5062, partial [Phenoliferia sp. Uapishka_3]
MFDSPRPATTAFDFTHPSGEATRGFTDNKCFGEYASSTPRVIAKLARHIILQVWFPVSRRWVNPTYHDLSYFLRQIDASEETRAGRVRRNHVLSLAEQKRRLDANHDFYEHFRLAVNKSSALTLAYMGKTLNEFEVQLAEQENLLDVMLSGAIDTEGHPRAKHLDAMPLGTLKNYMGLKLEDFSIPLPNHSPCGTLLERLEQAVGLQIEMRRDDHFPVKVYEQGPRVVTRSRRRAAEAAEPVLNVEQDLADIHEMMVGLFPRIGAYDMWLSSVTVSTEKILPLQARWLTDALLRVRWADRSKKSHSKVP